MKGIFFLTALFLIVFEQIADGLSLAGHKTTAGIIEFIYISGITLGLFAWVKGIKRFDYSLGFFRVLGGYVLLRFALADLVFNLSAGLPLFYIGTTKLYDKIWQWFFEWTQFSQVHFLFMFKLIALCIGLSWLIRERN